MKKLKHHIYIFTALLSVMLLRGTDVLAQVVKNIHISEGIEENRIYWDPFFNATSYTVFWSTQPGAYPNGNQVMVGNQNTFAHANLTAGQKYYYNIIATIAGQVTTPPAAEVKGTPAAAFMYGGNEDGYMMQSSCMLDLAGNGIAAAPAGVTANASVAQNMIYWNPIGGAISYDINRSTTSGGPYATVSAANTNIYFVDNSATPLTTYYYVVTANFGGGCPGGTSNEVSVTTVAAFDSLGGGSEDGYDMNVSCMLDLAGNGIAAAPAGVTANASIAQNMIYWNPIGGAISYDINRSTTSGGPYSTVSAANSNIYFVDNSATPLTTYYYVVTANFGGGCPGGTSNEVSVTTVAAFDSLGGGSEDGYDMNASCMLDLAGNGIAAAPAGVTANASIAQNMIYWNPIGGAISYDINRSTTSGGPYSTVSAANGNIYFVDNSASPLTTYYYVVTANFGGGCPGGTSNEVSVTTVAAFDSLGGGSEDGYHMNSSCMLDLAGNGIAAAPAGVTANASIAQNMIYWNPIGGAISYDINRGTTSGGPYSTVSSANTNIYFVDNSATPLTTYFYVVTANFGGGCPGGTSNEVSVTTVAAFDSLGGGSEDGYDMNSSCYLITLNGLGQVAVASSGSTTFCQGDSIILTAAGASVYAWSNGETTQSIVVNQPGNFSVSTTTGSCSGNSTNIQVLVNPGGSVSLTASGNKICPGDSVALSGNGSNTYAWSPAQSVSTSTGSSTYAKPLTTTLYTLTGTDGNGCQASDTVTIQVVNLQAPVISSNASNQICIGDSVILTSSPASTYSWSTGETTAAITVKNAGTYTVDIQDISGCKNNSLPTTISVNPLPFAKITTIGSSNFCQGDSVTLQVNAGSAYSWSNGSSNQSIVVNSAGNYTATLTDANGCSASSAPETVNVKSLPSNVVSLSGPFIFCQGDSVILSAASGNQYQWSAGQTTQNVTIKQSGNFTVNVTGSNGCSQLSAPISISANALPDTSISVSGALSFCQGGSVTLTAQPNMTYQWSNGASTQSIVVTQSGNYSVQLGNLSNCTGNSSVYTVAVQPKPSNNITASGPLSFCQGDSVVLSAAAGNTYAWSNGETTQNIHIKQSGTYTVQLTTPFSCADVSLPLTTTVNPLPTAGVNVSGPLTFCQGDSVTLTSTQANSYLWSNAATTQSIQVKQTGNYFVKVSDNNSCSAISSTNNVQVNALPSALITASGSLTFCTGDSIVLSAQPNLSYSWSNGATTQSILVKQSGNFTVTVTNSFGCSDISQISSVQVNTKPPTQITPSGPLSFCQGDSVALVAPAGYIYLWSGGQTTQSVQIKQSGSYSVYITDNSACFGTSSLVNVQVKSKPVANITAGGPLTFCQGGSVLLTASKAQNYLWSNGLTTQSVNITQSGNYTVNVTDSNSCSTLSSSVNVLVNALPTANITASGALTFCQGDSVILTADLNTSYLWSNGASSRNIVVKSAGNYSVTVKNASNCSATSSTVNISVNALPTANISAGGPLSFCQGGSVTLTAALANAYVWSNGATTQSVVINSTGSFSVKITGNNTCQNTSSPISVNVFALPNATITPAGTTTLCSGDSVLLQASTANSWLWSNGATTQNIYVSASGNYFVNITNANSCQAKSATSIVKVVSKPNPSISASGPLSFCTGSSVNLTASSALTYSWSNGATTQSISANTTGNYTVVVTDSNTCKGTSSVTAVQVNALPAANITPSGPTSFCPGSNVVLSASAGSSWLWSNGATTQNITASTSGSYTVVVTNAAACSATSAPVVVSVFPSVTATITASGPLAFCQGQNVILTANAGNSYQWSNGSTTQSIQVSTSGNYTVIVTGATSCYASSQPTIVTVHALPNPLISTIGNTTFCQGDSVKLSTGNFKTYSWSNGATTQAVTIKTSGNYTVSVTDTNGCANSSSGVQVTIHALPSVSINANGPLSFCQGGVVALTSTPSKSYLWSNGSTTQSVNASYSGTYSVTVTDSNTCKAKASVQVQVYSLPALPQITANGNILTTNSAASYQWYLNGNPLNGATSQSYTAVSSGNYTVSITDINGCSNTSDPKYINVIGIEEIYLTDQVLVYPDPFVEKTHLSYTLNKKCKVTIQIFNVVGQKVSNIIHDEQQFPGEYEFTMGENLVQGVYFILLQTNGVGKIYKIVKAN